jgi:hypothetical protein
VFGQWLHTKWSHAVHSIRFAEKPILRRADAQNEESIYRNRVTQLWVQPKALVREGQIRGIPKEIIEELCSRKWHEKRHNATMACVEEKKEMKKRTGKSPDLGDTFCMLIDNGILNGFLDVIEIRKDDRARNKSWKLQVGHQMGIKSSNKSLVAMPATRRLNHTRKS